MSVNNLLDLYTDYLLVTPTYSTAIGLSSVTDNKVSHYQFTRLLFNHITSSTQWQQVKPLFHAISSDDSLQIIDDS